MSDNYAIPKQGKLRSKFFRPEDNTPFLSYLVPLFQNESLCKTFHIKMSLICLEKKPEATRAMSTAEARKEFENIHTNLETSRPRYSFDTL